MSVPDELSHYLRREMLPEFYRRVGFQAEIRDLDGPLPWPEELERPGWSTRVLPKGRRRWEYVVCPEPAAVVEDGVPARSPWTWTDTVDPELCDEVETMHGRWFIGLGWYIPSRELVVFTDLVEPTGVRA